MAVEIVVAEPVLVPVPDPEVALVPPPEAVELGLAVVSYLVVAVAMAWPVRYASQFACYSTDAPELAIVTAVLSSIAVFFAVVRHAKVVLSHLVSPAMALEASASSAVVIGGSLAHQTRLSADFVELPEALTLKQSHLNHW